MGINYYNDRVCLNVLGGSLDNAKEIYEMCIRDRICPIMYLSDICRWR